ncbi:DUF6660 family protein [Fibrella forsythiae]|uniref:DUF6660 family protein n=1 Tax=Fibrella forsythiae TaxID=2817061 RepID=UPI00286DC82B|nr:DUF6660 family protein [Fibrella forsythiae]
MSLSHFLAHSEVGNRAVVERSSSLFRTSWFLTTCCISWRRTFETVKWLTLILSVYLLGLSLWPCSDGPLLLDGQTEQAMIVAAAGSERSHHEHDRCTPFCTCACCAVTITVVSRFHYSLLPSVDLVTIAVALFTYAPVHPLNPITAIWQPPQLRV